MTAIPRFERIVLAGALGLPCAASLWLIIWMPGAVSRTTYAIGASLVVAIATVTLHTWKSAQPTGSVGQLLYETNAGDRIEMGPKSRWERWLLRYDRSAARGRTIAVVILSLGITAIIVAAWLA